MKEEIDWEKKYLQVGSSIINLQRIYQKIVQRIKCKKSIWDIFIQDGKKFEV